MNSHRSPRHQEATRQPDYDYFARLKAVGLMFDLFALQHPEGEDARSFLQQTLGSTAVSHADQLRRSFQPLFNQIELQPEAEPEQTMHQRLAGFCIEAVRQLDENLPAHPERGDAVTIEELLPPPTVVAAMYDFHVGDVSRPPHQLVSFVENMPGFAEPRAND